MSKKEELSRKYSRLLREGKTSEATRVAREAKKLEKGDDYYVESSDDGEEEQGSTEGFEALNGVGPELAEQLVEEFGSVENLSDATVEDLEPIPGIGVKRAESLLEQV